MSKKEFPVIHRAGDRAILVEFGRSFSLETSQAVLAFDAALRDAPEGVVETVPTVRSVLVVFDPLRLRPEALLDWCRSIAESCDWRQMEMPATRRHWVLPAVYGGQRGPQLAEVAELSGISPEQLVENHTSLPLTVLCLGFSPGLAYLAELPEEFSVPRLQSFGKPVPAGSILVANRQTVLPGTPIPTGWRRIGWTPFRTFDPDRPNPFLLAPGDRVRFTAITEEEASRFDQEAYVAEQVNGDA